MNRGVLQGATALLGFTLFAGNLYAQPNTSSTADQRLAEILRRATAQRGGTTPAASALTPAQREERLRLLARGEDALSQMNVALAQQFFEQAALMQHAADSEIALVRTAMQAGAYRRALSLAAHTAGAHQDEARAAALYAQLLFAGGQRDVAARTQQRETRSGDAELSRFIPYSSPVSLPKSARVVTTGVLINAGTHVIAPSAHLPKTTSFWVRNGKGESVKASIERRIEKTGLALLRLHHPLQTENALTVAPRDPFPGSPGFVVTFALTDGAKAAWPVLTPGFVGGVSAKDAAERLLGIAIPPNANAGVVFDQVGRLSGIALSNDRVQLLSALKPFIAPTAATASSPFAQSMSIDMIYELSLSWCVQVIA